MKQQLVVVDQVLLQERLDLWNSLHQGTNELTFRHGHPRIMLERWRYSPHLDADGPGWSMGATSRWRSPARVERRRWGAPRGGGERVIVTECEGGADTAHSRRAGTGGLPPAVEASCRSGLPNCTRTVQAQGCLGRSCGAKSRYRWMVGLLNEFFLAANDDEARQAVRDGAVAAGWVEPVIEASGWNSLEIELLEEAITGRPWSPGGLDVITEDDDDPEGPFVVRFPEGVIDALLELSTSEVLPAAERWASFEELDDADPAVLASVLDDFIRLVPIGASSGKKPYLWVCL